MCGSERGEDGCVEVRREKGEDGCVEVRGRGCVEVRRERSVWN